LKIGSTFPDFCAWLVFILLILSLVLTLIEIACGVYHRQKMERTASQTFSCFPLPRQLRLELPPIFVEDFM